MQTMKITATECSKCDNGEYYNITLQ